jgi:hypothetical protein
LGYLSVETVMILRALIITFCLAGCAAKQGQVPAPPAEPAVALPNPWTVESGHLIPASEIDSVRAEAESGDAGAASRLSLHYGRGSPEREYWQRIAADLGSPAAQYNEWVRLSKGPDCESKLSALKFLEKAATAGVEVATWKLDAYRVEVRTCRNGDR